MAESVYKPKSRNTGGSDESVSRIRITLTSRDVPALEKLCSDLKNRAEKENVMVAGPVR